MNNRRNSTKSLNNLNEYYSELNINNEIKAIESLNNLNNYFNQSNINQSNINNLDNLLVLKKILIGLPKTNNDLIDQVKKLNKIIDNNVLDILTKKINNILNEYLESLSKDIISAQESNSTKKVENMIKKIYNDLSKYYIYLQYCYNLNLNNYPGMNKYLEEHISAKKYKSYKLITNNKLLKSSKGVRYYSSIIYDICDLRIIQNIRCCMRIIIFLSVRFNYGDFGLLTKKSVKVITKKGSFFSKEEFKLVERNMIKDEFIRNLSRLYPGINEESIKKFETLRKIIGCDYYWSNNKTKEIFNKAKGECDAIKPI